MDGTRRLRLGDYLKRSRPLALAAYTKLAHHLEPKAGEVVAFRR